LRPGHQGEARFQSNLNRQLDAGTSVHVRTLPRRGKWDEKPLQRNRHDAPWAIATPPRDGFPSRFFCFLQKLNPTPHRASHREVQNKVSKRALPSIYLNGRCDISRNTDALLEHTPLTEGTTYDPCPKTSTRPKLG
jgi:hypothetical protein